MLGVEIGPGKHENSIMPWMVESSTSISNVCDCSLSSKSIAFSISGLQVFAGLRIGPGVVVVGSAADGWWNGNYFEGLWLL